MSVKEIAELLVKQGHKVNVKKRSDGGYIITSIDGMKYVGATGNIEARRIVGATLSHAREYQLKRIKPPKRVAPAKRKKEPLPEELERELRKVQKEWRKTHKDISGTASKSNVRYYYETYGFEEAMASLDKNMRYAQGYAYFENVNWIIERLKMDKTDENTEDHDVIDEIIDSIKDIILTFKEEWIHTIHEDIYEYEHHKISVQELQRRIKATMK